jgi:hypothetical protein
MDKVCGRTHMMAPEAPPDQMAIGKHDPMDPPDAMSLGAGLKPKGPDGPWNDAKVFPTFERHSFEHKPRFSIEDPKRGISL